MTWIYKIVLVLAGCHQVAFAEITTIPRVSGDEPRGHVASGVDKEHIGLPQTLLSKETVEGPRVRIGLRLTPFVQIVNQAPNGQRSIRFIPAEPLRHTLRARMNTINHFFVSDWHIESKPLRWIKKTGRYDMRLTFYRRYGAFGQLEEHIGSVDAAGVLGEEKERVHVLIGVTRQRLRDKLGNPYLDVVAGFAPVPTTTPFDLSKVDRSPPKGPAEPPSNYSGPFVRQRF